MFEINPCMELLKRIKVRENGFSYFLFIYLDEGNLKKNSNVFEIPRQSSSFHGVIV